MFIQHRGTLINSKNILYVSINVDDDLNDHVQIYLADKTYVNIYPYGNNDVEDMLDKIIKILAVEEKIINV